VYYQLYEPDQPLAPPPHPNNNQAHFAQAHQGQESTDEALMSSFNDLMTKETLFLFRGAHA
jgi:hypothetical protein